MAMFILYVLLTSGREKVSWLRRATEVLITIKEGNTPGHTYCTRAMQLKIAAGSPIWLITDYKEAKDQSAPRKKCVKRSRDWNEPEAPRVKSLSRPP